MADLARERLSRYFPEGGLKKLGFHTTDVSGYIMPNGRLMAHYNGEVVREAEGQAEPDIRRILVVTDGQNWFAGARSGTATSSQMLRDMVIEGIYGGKASRYAIRGEDLPNVLADPFSLPDIESPQREKVPVKINTYSHSFE